jgi:hypothetical protein
MSWLLLGRLSQSKEQIKNVVEASILLQISLCTQIIQPWYMISLAESARSIRRRLSRFVLA